MLGGRRKVAGREPKPEFEKDQSEALPRDRRFDPAVATALVIR